MDLDDFGAQLASRLTSLVRSVDRIEGRRIKNRGRQSVVARPNWRPHAMGIPSGDESEDWRGRAACFGSGTDFWPDIGLQKTGERNLILRRARAVCNLCPVSEECLAFAVKTHQPYGIWGGKSAEERRRIRKGQVASA